MQQLMHDVEAVLKRHGDLSDEEVEEEAREVVAVFAQRSDDLVAQARSNDSQLLGALIDIARGARRAARIQIVLSAAIAIYMLAWTVAVSATHAL